MNTGRIKRDKERRKRKKKERKARKKRAGNKETIKKDAETETLE